LRGYITKKGRNEDDVLLSKYEPET